MKVPNNPLQVKFAQRDLVTVSGFINYCKKNGLKINKEALYFYEKKKLIFPAVRVFKKYFKCKKVVKNNRYQLFYKVKTPKEKYESINEVELYSLGYPSKGSFLTDEEIESFNKKGLIFSTPDNWLDQYEKEGLLTYPTISEFVEPEKRKTTFHEYSQNKRELGWPFIDYYDKYQLLAIFDIKNFLSLHVSNQALLSMAKTEINKANLHTLFDEERLIPMLQKRISITNQVIHLIHEIENLWRERNTHLNKFKKTLNLDDYAHLNEIKAEINHAELEHLNHWKAEARDLCKKFEIKAETVSDIINRVLQVGSFGVIGVKKKYVAEIENYTLTKEEEAYRLVNFLSWFRWLLGAKRLSVKQYILNSQGIFCKYCHRSFIPKRKTQYVCPDPYCQNERRKDTVNLGRKTGKYKN